MSTQKKRVRWKPQAYASSGHSTLSLYLSRSPSAVIKAMAGEEQLIGIMPNYARIKNRTAGQRGQVAKDGTLFAGRLLTSNTVERAKIFPKTTK